ncbi:BPI fold-containing family A member 2 [Myotis lucifugus]|uniref:BPI fold-containing family A member 2 n=1 Tax=Myotis lucifugus TaxID=59463 RepID=UPI0006D745A4|nr:BPI fold-containing family A member 2 [Myotis lucifugus]XP_023610142.1 BPI fold-containing family A member 2 [Myotis lucifugus]
MFQLWKLVLLCGLISGTSAGILQNLKEDLNLLRDTNGWQAIQDKFHQTKVVLNDALSKTIESIALGLKISNVHILNFKAEPTPDGQGVQLRFPTSADVSLTLPLIGQAVHLNVSLDLLATVEVETDPKSGDSRVVLTDCASDPDSISFTLLGEHSTLVNKLSGTISSLLSDTVSFLVQNQMCPLLRIFVSTLGPQFVENVINNGQQGADVPANA